MKKIDRVGQIFFRLTVVEFAYRLNRHSYWTCRCICGNKVIVSSSNLISKYKPTKSCGCWNREFTRANKLHGMSGTVEHQTWSRMLNRCYNKNFSRYQDWGGRGIKVSKRWYSSFLEFFKDMGKRPSNRHSLDRKDNNKGYSKKNCRWATLSEQRLNRRDSI